MCLEAQSCIPGVVDGRGEHWVQASVTHNNIVGIVPCETEDNRLSDARRRRSDREVG